MTSKTIYVARGERHPIFFACPHHLRIRRVSGLRSRWLLSTIKLVERTHKLKIRFRPTPKAISDFKLKSGHVTTRSRLIRWWIKYDLYSWRESLEFKVINCAYYQKRTGAHNGPLNFILVKRTSAFNEMHEVPRLLKNLIDRLVFNTEPVKRAI